MTVSWQRLNQSSRNLACLRILPISTLSIVKKFNFLTSKMADGRCPGMSGGRYTRSQSDLAADSTGTVQMPIGYARSGAHWRNLANTTEPFVFGCGLISNYFGHLLEIRMFNCGYGSDDQCASSCDLSNCC